MASNLSSSGEAELNDIADYEWLTSDEASHWLSECARSNEPSEVLQKRLRRVLSAERARLVAWQAILRRKAVEKFGEQAESMFFTDLALEQATDRRIAGYKAERFSGDEPIIDFCCGIGGDLLALAQLGSAIGWDRSPGMVTFARANIRAWGLETQARVLGGSVEDHPPAPNQLWHLDPDRRTDGHRSTHVEWHSPNENTIERWLSKSPNGAVKLAPATELPGEWQARAELEWISRGRQCRQLVAWFGELSESHGRRRATAIHGCDHASFVGDARQTVEVIDSIGAYVYDTDPAVRAANLTGALANKVGCAALSSGESYLTADRQFDHSLLSCFRVHDVLPLRIALIKKHLEGAGIGELEIKTRGVATNPEMVRKRVKLTGSRAVTLLLTRQGKREIAILAERVHAG